MTDLDELGRRAAADLQTAVLADADVPFALRRSQARLVAIGVALVAVVVASFLLLRPSDETVVADGPTEQEGDDGDLAGLHLRPSELPEGAVLLSAEERTRGVAVGQGLEPTWQQAWGRVGAQDPFADGDLVVLVSTWTQTPEAVSFHDLLGGRYEEVDVAGFQGAIVEGPSFAVPTAGGRTLYFQPRPDVLVAVSSRTSNDDELVTVGAGLEVGAGSVVPTIDPATVPDGLGVVATVHPLAFAPPDLRIRFGAPVTMTSWGGPAGRFLLSFVADADADVELLNRHGLGPGSEEVVVGDQRGWRSADRTVLLWRVEPDVLGVLHVEPDRFSDDELLAIAASVEPVDDETWAEMLAQQADEADTTATTASVGPVDDLGAPIDGFRIEGQRPDGRRSAIYIDGEGALCGALAMDDTGAFSSLCNDPSIPGVIYDRGRPIIVYGQAPPGVVEVRAQVGVMTFSSQIADPGGDRLWMFDLELAGVDDPPAEVVEHDAEGNEIRRVPVR